jgi:hypothetical protein
MPLPLVLGICEDDLERDLAFLKEFAGPKVDLRLTPTRGGGPGAKQVRILKRQHEAATRSKFEVRAFLVHSDADRTGHQQRRREMTRWFGDSGLESLGARLIRCVPEPCTEGWLCRIQSIRARGASPAAGCDPWKLAWERHSGHDLDRVREAAAKARQKLRLHSDFVSFYTDWKAAGLE